MGKCYLSGAEVESRMNHQLDGMIYESEFGTYIVSQSALLSYKQSLTEIEKLNLILETISVNDQGLTPFWIFSSDSDKIETTEITSRPIDTIKSRPLNHKDKEKTLLQLAAKILSKYANPFEFIQLTQTDLYRAGIFKDEEFYYWIVSLENKSLISLNDEAKHYLQKFSLHEKPSELGKYIRNHKYLFRLTTQGWDFLYEIGRNIESNSVFVALAFTDKNRGPSDSLIRSSIKEVIENSEFKFKANIVDEKEHNDGVMDEIIALINEAKFVVAELTHHKNGVYYEAGYAKGLGIPVIHVVNKDELEHSHFDIKHLNLIVWSDHQELKDKLRNRIKATIRKDN